MKKTILLCSAFLLSITSALACTSFLVGKKASADGSVFITYSMDSYGAFARLEHFPAMKHAPGTMRHIVDGDSNRPLGYIPEAPQTYAVMGNINEFQLSIMETTFGGREELVDTLGGIDYVSLMTLGLQRAKNAREAIKVMTDLAAEHGYYSSGESFSIADPNEIWILEMIGKGVGEKGAVWVAVRIPDDCIASHANHSRIHAFDLTDKKNVIASSDVISFARKKGYFTGNDEDFSFSKAYAPADFGAIRYCDARVWSFYNRWVEGMEQYLEYAKGYDIANQKPMPLYFKPKQKLSLKDVMNSMRDHYEGTYFDTQNDCSAGPGNAPYRPSPLSWKYEGKTYFNERPISTQQAAATMIAQLRENMPDEIGGILWWGNDEANMISYSPVYCSATKSPLCFNDPTASDVKFSWNSAFWVCNWVANMTYPRYEHLFPDVLKVREQVENANLAMQPAIEAQAQTILKTQGQEAVREYLTQVSAERAELMMQQWRNLGQYLIVKHNDMVVKKEENGQFKMTPYGIADAPQRPGFNDPYRATIVRETGDKYLLPE